jgi:calcineurin-like phosphoesterase family protein
MKGFDTMLPGIYDAFQHWGEQTVWIYSDPHFSDEDLEYGIKNRPSDEEQIRRINAKAGRKDTLIILGDVGNIECVRKLRAGRKVLICGNHDLGATRYKREVVKEIYDKDKMTREEAVADMQAKYPGWKVWAHEDYDFHSPFERWNVYADNMLFDEVYEGALIVGEKLILSHEPVEIPWLYNIHGHDHAGKKRKNHLNVCSDVIGYEPVNLTQKLKSGLMSAITTIHRATIDSATERKAKRGGKKIGAK